MSVEYIPVRIKDEFPSKLLDITRRNVKFSKSERILSPNHQRSLLVPAPKTDHNRTKDISQRAPPQIFRFFPSVPLRECT